MYIFHLYTSALTRNLQKFGELTFQAKKLKHAIEIESFP